MSEQNLDVKPPLTFELTEEQRDDVAFAVLCQAESLEESDEHQEFEVQTAIGNLWAAYKVLHGGWHNV